jgi:hypothetical protein
MGVDDSTPNAASPVKKTEDDRVREDDPPQSGPIEARFRREGLRQRDMPTRPAEDFHSVGKRSRVQLDQSLSCRLGKRAAGVLMRFNGGRWRRSMLAPQHQWFAR